MKKINALNPPTLPVEDHVHLQPTQHQSHRPPYPLNSNNQERISMDTRSPFHPSPRSTSHEHTLDLGPEEIKDFPQNKRSKNISNESNSTPTIVARQEVLNSPDSSPLHITAVKALSMSSLDAQSGGKELVGTHLSQAPVPGRLNPRSTISSNADLLEHAPSQVTQKHPPVPLSHHLFTNDATTTAPFNNLLQEEDTLLDLPQEDGHCLPYPPSFACPRYTVNDYIEPDEAAREDINRK